MSPDFSLWFPAFCHLQKGPTHLFKTASDGKVESKNVHYLDPLTVFGNKGRISEVGFISRNGSRNMHGRVPSKVQLLPRISYSNEATILLNDPDYPDYSP